MSSSSLVGQITSSRTYSYKLYMYVRFRVVCVWCVCVCVGLTLMFSITYAVRSTYIANCWLYEPESI